MAGRGPAPKDPAIRAARGNVKQPTPATVVTETGQVFGPDLPSGRDWAAQTRVWWDTWRFSAQAQTMIATDWDFLLDTAVLHDRLWSGNLSVAPELRLRVAKFGATPEDRARLRLQITHESPEKAADKPSTSRYGHLRAVSE